MRALDDAYEEQESRQIRSVGERTGETKGTSLDQRLGNDLASLKKFLSLETKRMSCLICHLKLSEIIGLFAREVEERITSPSQELMTL